MELNSHHSKRYFWGILLTTISLWYVFNFFFGERIPVYDGFGYDGSRYVDIARHFWRYLHGHQLDLYYIQRIFPSFAIHSLSYIFNYSLTPPINAVRTFFFWDVLVISIGMYFFYRIVKLYEWNFNITLIGFSALFINVPIIKMMTYCPAWTDYTAFSLGIMMLYFYLTNNLLGLGIITLLGAFTYPTMLFTGTLLILFPIHSMNESKEKYLAEISLNLHYRFFIGFLIALSAAFYAYHAVMPSLTPPLLPLSLIVLFLYILLMILPFIRENTLIKINKTRLFLGIIFFCFIWIMHVHLSNKELGPLTAGSLINKIFWEATLYPLVHLVAHFAYYGPIVLLIVVNWKKLVTCAYQKGMGLYLVLLMYGILTIGSESRCFINALPVFVFLTCEILKETNITNRLTYGILTISLLMSKFWLPMNIGAPWPSIYPSGDAFIGFLVFPYQMYFMNFGPWLGWKMYVVELVVMIVVFFSWPQTRQPFLIGLGKLKNIATTYRIGRENYQ